MNVYFLYEHKKYGDHDQRLQTYAFVRKIRNIRPPADGGTDQQNTTL